MTDIDNCGRLVIREELTNENMSSLVDLINGNEAKRFMNLNFKVASGQAFFKLISGMEKPTTIISWVPVSSDIFTENESNEDFCIELYPDKKVKENLKIIYMQKSIHSSDDANMTDTVSHGCARINLALLCTINFDVKIASNFEIHDVKNESIVTLNFRNAKINAIFENRELVINSGSF